MDKSIEAKEVAAELTIRKYWTITGIEGVEDVFRQIFKEEPENLQIFQRVYDRIIGRKTKEV